MFLSSGSVIVIGRKPEMPQTPDSRGDLDSEHFASTTLHASSSNVVNPFSPSSAETNGNTPTNIAPQAPGGSSSVANISAFTPVIDLPPKGSSGTRTY